MVGGEKRPVTLPRNTGAAGDPVAPVSPGFAPSSHDVPDESVRIVLQGTSTAPAEPAPAPHINALTASAAAKRVPNRAAIPAPCRAVRVRCPTYPGQEERATASNRPAEP